MSYIIYINIERYSRFRIPQLRSNEKKVKTLTEEIIINNDLESNDDEE